MEDFEIQLKSVQLARPSGKLRSRIFREPAAQNRLRNILSRSITIGQAACLALAAGLLGYSASLLTAGAGERIDNQITVQHVIYEEGDAGHIWNFTDTETDFMLTEPTVSIEDDFEA